MAGIPNGFAPSPLAHGADYDHEAKLIETRPFDPNFDEEPELAARKSVYQTQAQDRGSITPFLKAAMHKDAPRRNYTVEPGGAIVYADEGVGSGVPRLDYDAPSRQESLGHNSIRTNMTGDH